MKTKYLFKFDPFKDETVRILDHEGKIVNKELLPKIDDKVLLEAYELMNLSRRQDEFQNKVQRQGRLLSFLSSTGQEACEVAYSILLQKGKDWLSPGYRNNAAWLGGGVPVKQIMMYWMGNEYGAKAPDGINVLPPNILIGTQFSLAAGIAFAEKYFKRDGVVATTTGDGGMSEGETYEAMNFAKLHELPVLFISENNKWAISTPIRKQTKSMNIAVKSVASGIPSIKVDGNDFLASYAVTKELIDYIRAGNGPVFIEYDTYRLGAHSSSDNPKIYRPEDEFQEALKKDPLIIMKKYLIDKKIWSEDKQKKLDEKQDEQIRKAFDEVEAIKQYPLEDVFDFVYAEKTKDLVEQYEEAKKHFAKYPLKGGRH